MGGLRWCTGKIVHEAIVAEERDNSVGQTSLVFPHQKLIEQKLAGHIVRSDAVDAMDSLDTSPLALHQIP
eukprot:6361111-Amphidinium_carterae.1